MQYWMALYLAATLIDISFTSETGVSSALRYEQVLNLLQLTHRTDQHFYIRHNKIKWLLLYNAHTHKHTHTHTHAHNWSVQPTDLFAADLQCSLSSRAMVELHKLFWNLSRLKWLKFSFWQYNGILQVYFLYKPFKSCIAVLTSPKNYVQNTK
jgi:hypothetical protein